MNKQRKKHGNVLFLNPQRFGLLKAILLIAVPVALQTIISVGINMVDTLMAVSYTHLDVYKRQL